MSGVKGGGGCGGGGGDQYKPQGQDPCSGPILDTCGNVKPIQDCSLDPSILLPMPCSGGGISIPSPCSGEGISLPSPCSGGGISLPSPCSGGQSSGGTKK